MDRVTKVGHPPELKKSPDLSMTVKQFSLTKQNDYSGHESTKIRMVQIFLKKNCLVYYSSYAYSTVQATIWKFLIEF